MWGGEQEGILDESLEGQECGSARGRAQPCPLHAAVAGAAAAAATPAILVLRSCKAPMHRNTTPAAAAASRRAGGRTAHGRVDEPLALVQPAPLLLVRQGAGVVQGGHVAHLQQCLCVMVGEG